MGNRSALFEKPKTAAGHRRPRLIVGQRHGGDHGHAVIGRRDVAEVDAQVLVAEMRDGKRRLANDVAQPGRAVRKQAIAVRQQEVERAQRADFQGQLMQGLEQLRLTGRTTGKTLPQILQQPAEGTLAVGIANRRETPVEFGSEVGQVAVVRKNPVATPEFTHEGMRVFERDDALRRLADVRDDVFRMNRIAAHNAGQRRGTRRQRLEEDPRAATFKESDPPAVRMHVGGTPTRLESGK